MKKLFGLLLLHALILISFSLHAQTHQAKRFKTQTEVALPIKDYGKVYNADFATDRPDPNMQYRIVFEASMEAFDSSMIYPPLEHLARMYNLHVFGGVPQKNLDVVLVIGGVGISAIMKNEVYKKRYGIDNPNLKILGQIKEAGIKINGCSQAMQKNDIAPEEVDPLATIIFSRFTTVSSYQMKGYAYFKF